MAFLTTTIASVAAFAVTLTLATTFAAVNRVDVILSIIIDSTHISRPVITTTTSIVIPPSATTDITPTTPEHSIHIAPIRIQPCYWIYVHGCGLKHLRLLLDDLENMISALREINVLGRA